MLENKVTTTWFFFSTNICLCYTTAHEWRFHYFMSIEYTENIYELSLLRFCSFVDLGKIYSLGDIDSSKLILTFKLSEFTLQIIYSQGSSRVVYLHNLPCSISVFWEYICVLSCLICTNALLFSILQVVPELSKDSGKNAGVCAERFCLYIRKLLI